jgi:hypothetical protein
LIRKYQNGIASFIEDGKKVDITGMHLFNLDIAEKQKDA